MQIPPTPALGGEYLHAMEAISVRLMDALPDEDDLWRILGQTEAFLLEAQAQKCPIHEVIPCGIAAFCQSIIDERIAGAAPNATPVALSRKHPASAQKPVGSNARRARWRLTALVITVWLLVVALLLAWYCGIFNYLVGGSTFYLKEPHNFQADVAEIPDTACTISIPLQAHSLTDTVLYHDGTHCVTLSDVGYDELTLPHESGSEHSTVYYWWITVNYTVNASFLRISTVAPSETGTSVVTLPNGDTLSGELEWGDEGALSDGNAYVKLYIACVGKDLHDDARLTAEVTFAPMRRVVRTRTGVGMI